MADDCSSDGIEHFTIQPRYKQIFCSPHKKFKEWKNKRKEDKSTLYGPPYLKNELVEEALLDICSKPLSLKSVHECLAFKVDPNVPSRGNYNNRPLHFAAKFGNKKLMKMLLSAGGDPEKANAVGQTPLMIASRGAKSGHTACVQLLLSINGCDVEKKDRSGGTALNMAILGSNVRTVQTLLEHGVNLNWEKSVSSYEKCYNTSSPVALNIAKEVRAMITGIDVSEASVYFARLESSSWPLLWDKIMKKRLYSPAHTVVKLIESSIAGDLPRQPENTRTSRQQKINKIKEMASL